MGDISYECWLYQNGLRCSPWNFVSRTPPLSFVTLSQWNNVVPFHEMIFYCLAPEPTVTQVLILNLVLLWSCPPFFCFALITCIHFWLFIFLWAILRTTGTCLHHSIRKFTRSTIRKHYYTIHVSLFRNNLWFKMHALWFRNPAPPCWEGICPPNPEQIKMVIFSTCHNLTSFIPYFLNVDPNLHNPKLT